MLNEIFIIMWELYTYIAQLTFLITFFVIVIGVGFYFYLFLFFEF